MKRYSHFVILTLLCCTSQLKAQWVTVPDPAFVNYLQTYYPSYIVGNQIDTTSFLFEHANALYVDNEGISNLDGIQYFDSLITLSCRFNLLTNLPPLPHTLLNLDFSYNPTMQHLPILPVGLHVLQFINCSIDSVLSLPDSLTWLEVTANPLAFLPVIPSGLQGLYCDSTNLTSLQNLPTGLSVLYCNNSNITCLPTIPDTMDIFFFGGNPLTCLPNYPYVSIVYDIDPHLYPLCSPTNNPYGCPISQCAFGHVYNDVNTNCNNDGGDFNLINIPVQLIQGGVTVQQTFSNNFGFSFNAPLASYTALIDTTELPFVESCLHLGLDSSFTLTALDSIIENVDFGLICKPGFDVGVFSITKTYGDFHPGNTTNIQVRAGDAAFNYLNTSCNTVGLSGIVQITFNGPITFLSATLGSLNPSVSGNVLTYTISDFSLIDINDDFGMLFFTDTLAVDSEMVCFYITISASGVDNYPANNSLSHCFEVNTSFDPNAKEVSPVGDVAYPFSDWLTYTIYFQNTGSAPATNIMLKDTIDIDLDESSFRLLDYSYPTTVNILGNIATFNFYNINLPDSNTNEPLSHGYVQYKIKPNELLPIGTTITNTADIYFDYNPPITTNTTTTVINSIGIESVDELKFQMYPNPANDYVLFNYEGEISHSIISIHDMLGGTLKLIPVTSNQTVVSTSDLPSGIYMVNIHINGKLASKKLVVSKY